MKFFFATSSFEISAKFNGRMLVESDFDDDGNLDDGAGWVQKTYSNSDQVDDIDGCEAEDFGLLSYLSIRERHPYNIFEDGWSNRANRVRHNAWKARSKARKQWARRTDRFTMHCVDGRIVKPMLEEETITLSSHRLHVVPVEDKVEETLRAHNDGIADDKAVEAKQRTLITDEDVYNDYESEYQEACHDFAYGHGDYAVPDKYDLYRMVMCGQFPVSAEVVASLRDAFEVGYYDNSDDDYDWEYRACRLTTGPDDPDESPDDSDESFDDVPDELDPKPDPDEETWLSVDFHQISMAPKRAGMGRR